MEGDTFAPSGGSLIALTILASLNRQRDFTTLSLAKTIAISTRIGLLVKERSFVASSATQLCRARVPWAGKQLSSNTIGRGEASSNHQTAFANFVPTVEPPQLSYQPAPAQLMLCEVQEVT